jgi:hypothetical protein
MGFAVGPWVPTLMIAEADLYQASWAGRLPNVAIGDPFWASSRDVPSLIAADLASIAPEDTIAPPVEPRFCAYGQAGFGAGTSNSSY